MKLIASNAPRIGFAKWENVEMRLILILIMVSLGFAQANPLVAPSAAGAVVYIASEQLRVELSDRAAEFRGDFKFRRQPKSPPTSGAGGLLLDLPVWVPSAGTSDAATREVLGLFGTDQKVVFSKKELSKIEKLLALRVTLGNRPLRVSQVFLNDTLDYGTKGLEHRYWQTESGLACLILRFDIATVKELENQNLAISYRQPYSWTNGVGQFYYVPFFEGLPKDRTTTDKKLYSITLSPATNCTLHISGLDKRQTVSPGQNMVLSPQHQQPIRAEVKSIMAKARVAQPKNRPAQPQHSAVVQPHSKK